MPNLSTQMPMRSNQSIQLSNEYEKSKNATQFSAKCMETSLHLIDEEKAKEVFDIFLAQMQCVNDNKSHPFLDLQTAIAEGKKRQKNASFGAHFSGLGSPIVRSGHIWADMRNIEDTLTYCLQFKLHDFAREDMKIVCEFIKENQKQFENHFEEFFPKGITIAKEFYRFKSRDEDGVYKKLDYIFYNKAADALRIDFHGIGKVVIGNNPETGCFYTNVEVELDAALSQEKVFPMLNAMLCSLGLGAATTQHGLEDRERMKVAKIFRMYCPREATKLETKRQFYIMTPSELQKTCEKEVFMIKDIFQKYLIDSPELLKEEEIYLGRTTWAITDFGMQLRQKGAWGLRASVSKFNVEPLDCVPLLLQDGMLASHDRFQTGLRVHGLSSAADLQSGGGGYVFTRLVKWQEMATAICDDTIQLLFDLEVLNRGGYAYKKDHYGVKNPASADYQWYQERSNLLEFADTLTQMDVYNEVMIKHRIAPEFIKGIIATTESGKEMVIKTLDKAGLIEKRDSGQYIFGKPIDSFIHCTRHYEQTFWK